MQKTNCYMKSELPSGKKQDHAFKKWRDNQGKIKQGHFCGQFVTSQLLLSVFTEVCYCDCNNHTVTWKV